VVFSLKKYLILQLLASIKEIKLDTGRLSVDSKSTFYVSLAHVLLVLAQCNVNILFSRQLNVSLAARPAVTSKCEMYVNNITACIKVITRKLNTITCSKYNYLLPFGNMSYLQ